MRLHVFPSLALALCAAVLLGGCPESSTPIPCLTTANCPAGQYCDLLDRFCHEGVCPQECGTRECGPDPRCGFSCGACEAGETCTADGQCEGGCVPQCTGKECGPDGCGGLCGTCPTGQACDAGGQCQGTCVPDCTGKACGDDGCNGSCGTCGVGETCNARGQCVACTPDCTGRACGSDGCGGSCGTCGAGETCDAAGQCVACTPDCTGRACGSDGCGGSCGACGAGEFCNASFQCEPICTPDCAGKDCGSDGCGGSCGACGAGEFCNASFQCEPICTPDCAGRACGGDGCGGSCGTCEPGETCNADGQCVGCTPNCMGRQCGPDPLCGISCGSCEPNEACNAAGQCVANCVPDCTNRQCGLDPVCGTSCGTCGANEFCDAQGQCQPVCVPDCAGRECGPDGCGGTCGACVLPEVCNAQGQCACTPDCAGRECGPDGCGGSCGTCQAGQECTLAGQCVGCTPNCAGLQCGPDPVCGVSCGTCQLPDVCNASGQCVCVPDCTGRQCGPDPACGQSCGTCPVGMECSALGQCQAPPGEHGDLCVDSTDCGAGLGCIMLITGELGYCGAGCSCSDGSGCPAGLDPAPVCLWNLGSTCGCGYLCPNGQASECPDGGQGWLCYAITGGFACAVDSCQANCAGRQCGPDPTCGANCGLCQAGQVCDAAGQCVAGGQQLGEPCTFGAVNAGSGACTTGLECLGLPEDPSYPCSTDQNCIDQGFYANWNPDCVVGTGCGVSFCASICGTGNTCPAGYAPTMVGSTCYCIPANTCTPDCAGRQCGPDGCGGSCGTCPSGQSCNASGQCVSGTCSEVLQDPSFESGSSSAPWAMASSAYGTPLCDLSSCGANNARTGSWYLWVGGGLADDAYAQQAVTIPAGTATLGAYVRLSGTVAADYFRMTVDGTEVGRIQGDHAAYQGAYALFEVNVSAYADGGSHLVRLHGVVTTTSGSILVDDASLWACSGSCTPDCAGRQCGPDGCGGSCGTCPSGQSCNASGQCVSGACGAIDLGAFSGAPIVRMGDTCSGTNLYNAAGGGTSCTGYSSSGNEVVYSLVVPAGQELQVEMVGTGFDASLWITYFCDDYNGLGCMAGADDPEALVFTNPGAADTFYIVADAYAGCGAFTLSISGARPPLVGDLVINEAHADPHASLGDANCNGTVENQADEFLEIVNVSADTLILDGVTLADLIGVRHTFPAGTRLQPGKAVVVYGGPAPACTFAPGNLMMAASSGQLALNNTNETVTMALGTTTLATVSWTNEASADQSITRNPDLTGGFVQHTTVAPGLRFSPAARVDGTPF